MRCIFADLKTARELANVDCFGGLPGNAPHWLKTLKEARELGSSGRQRKLSKDLLTLQVWVTVFKTSSKRDAVSGVLIGISICRALVFTSSKPFFARVSEISGDSLPTFIQCRLHAFVSEQLKRVSSANWNGLPITVVMALGLISLRLSVYL